MAHMFIVNPLKGMSFAGLFSTHPPLEERIRRLRAMQPRSIY
jgi:heat shock protein HtpX